MLYLSTHHQDKSNNKSIFGKVNELEENEFWGIETAVDVYDCDPQIIRDKEAVKEYVRQLLELIEMKSFNPPCESCGSKDDGALVVHFGEDEKISGFSMVQLIETSLLSAHFANSTNRAFINIFSCKGYDVDLVCKFTCEYFKGKEKKRNVNYR